MSYTIFKPRPHVWHVGIVGFNNQTGKTDLLVQDDKGDVYATSGIGVESGDIANLLSINFKIPRNDIHPKGERRNRMRIPLFEFMVIDSSRKAPF